MPRTSDAKERLTEAATDLIWGYSYGATSVDAICERAGVKKGSFYHFFASKSELAIAALETYWRTRKAHLDSIFSPTVPPLERLSDFFGDVVQRQVTRQKTAGSVLGCPIFALGSEVSTQDEAIRSTVHHILDHYVKYFESAIRDAHAQGLLVAPNAKAKARMLFAFLEGMLTQARIQNNLEILRDMQCCALDMLGATREYAVAV